MKPLRKIERMSKIWGSGMKTSKILPITMQLCIWSVWCCCMCKLLWDWLTDYRVNWYHVPQGQWVWSDVYWDQSWMRVVEWADPSVPMSSSPSPAAASLSLSKTSFTFANGGAVSSSLLLIIGWPKASSRLSFETLWWYFGFELMSQTVR